MPLVSPDLSRRIMTTRSAYAIGTAITYCICSGCSEVPGSDVPQDVVQIIIAIDNSDVAGLRTLLENGAIPTPDGSPISPIRAATTHFENGKLVCDSEAMKLLLDHGANPNFIDQYSGFAPLEEALAMGDRECIMLLRNAGASIDTHGASGQSLLQFAVKGVERTGDITLLGLVVSWGVSPNVGVDDADGSSFTALHEAAWMITPKLQDAVVAELLGLGTDPCIRNRGQTALDVAENLKRSPNSQALLRAAMKSCPPRTLQ
jgi:hypothetical protein